MNESLHQPSEGAAYGGPAPSWVVAERDAEIARLKSRIETLEESLATSSEARAAAAIALLEDANSWAQHFSNVRLAVATFLSGICLGIMSFKWDDPQPIFVWSTLAVWLLGMTMFVIFSLEQWRKLDQRRRNVQALRGESDGSAGERDGVEPLRGFNRVTREWLRQKDWAYPAYFALSAVFLAAWRLWWTRPPAGP